MFLSCCRSAESWTDNVTLTPRVLYEDKRSRHDKVVKTTEESSPDETLHVMSSDPEIAALDTPGDHTALTMTTPHLSSSPSVNNGSGDELHSSSKYEHSSIPKLKDIARAEVVGDVHHRLVLSKTGQSHDSTSNYSCIPGVGHSAATMFCEGSTKVEKTRSELDMMSACLQSPQESGPQKKKKSKFKKKLKLVRKFFSKNPKLSQGDTIRKNRGSNHEHEMNQN